jgi:hypothetical protein
MSGAGFNYLIGVNFLSETGGEFYHKGREEESEGSEGFFGIARFVLPQRKGRGE